MGASDRQRAVSERNQCARAGRKVSQNAGRFLTHPAVQKECSGGGGKWGGGSGGVRGRGEICLWISG